MNRKRVGHELLRVALPVGVCAAAVLLQVRAWRIGRHHPETGLMPVLAGYFVVSGLAWLSCVPLFRAAARREAPAGVTVADLVVLAVVVPGCLGCYPLWPLVLLVMVLLCAAVALSRRAEGGGRDWALVRRAAVTAVLFTVTWYCCATARRHALHAFAERVEATVDEDQLLDWAAGAVEARRRAPRDNPEDHNAGHLTGDRIPQFAHDLMGGRPERTRVEVRVIPGVDPYVTISSSAQEALRVTVRPSRAPHRRGPGPPYWVFRETGGFDLRPGLYIDTAGNFR